MDRLAEGCIATVVLSILLGCGGGGGGGRYGEYEDESAYEQEAEVESDPSDVDASEVGEVNFDSCTSDCSGHDAGSQWAEENDVTDESECGGNSASFTEGCVAFAEQRAEVAEEQAIEDAQAQEESYDEYESEQY